MDKLANDKAFAEYCGYEAKILTFEDATFEQCIILGIRRDKSKIITSKKGLFEKIWNPSEDWNQLMEVVEKIEEDGCEVFHHKNTCRIWKESGLYNGHTQIARAEADTKIQAVYQAVVEFVKQYGGN